MGSWRIALLTLLGALQGFIAAWDEFKRRDEDNRL